MSVALLGSPGSTSETGIDGASAYTAFTYTVSAGTNRLLVLFIAIGDDDFLAASAVTYGGQAMTLVPGYLSTDGIWTTTQAWFLKEAGIAAAGSTTFSVTWVSTLNALTHLIVGAAAFSGVDQTTPLGTPVIANGSSTAPSTGSITVPANGLAIGSMATDDDNAFVQASTLLFEVEGVGGDTGGGAQYRSTTGSLDWTTDNQQWAVAGVALNPSGGATAALTGTAVGGITEADIVAGSKTIVITLTGDTWIAS